MDSNSLDILVAIAQILTALITCASLIFTFCQFRKSLKLDYSKELRDYCLNFNEKVLFPLRSIKSDDIFYTYRSKASNKKITQDEKDRIHKIFFEMDAFCAHVKSIYKNDDKLVDEINNLCGHYIRYVADKIIVYCYCKKRDLNNPYSPLFHLDIIMQIVNKKINNYNPQEKYDNLVFKYKEFKDRTDKMNKDVKTILQDILDIYNNIKRFVDDPSISNSKYDLILNSLKDKTDDILKNYLFPLNEFDFDNAKNEYILNIKTRTFNGKDNLDSWNERIEKLNNFYDEYILTNRIDISYMNNDEKEKFGIICDNIYEILP